MRAQFQLLPPAGNRSSNWGGVKLLCPAGVSFDSSLDKIRGCYFNGNIFIGLFVKTTMMSGGVSVLSGLYNSNFSGNCVLSDNCYVWNSAMLMNVYVGRNSCVVGCGSVLGEGHTSFGTSRTIKVSEVHVLWFIAFSLFIHILLSGFSRAALQLSVQFVLWS